MYDTRRTHESSIRGVKGKRKRKKRKRKRKKWKKKKKHRGFFWLITKGNNMYLTKYLNGFSQRGTTNGRMAPRIWHLNGFYRAKKETHRSYHYQCRYDVVGRYSVYIPGFPIGKAAAQLESSYSTTKGPTYSMRVPICAYISW